MIDALLQSSASLSDPHFDDAQIVMTYGTLVGVHGTTGGDAIGAYGPGNVLLYDLTVQIDDTTIDIASATAINRRRTNGLVYAAILNVPIVVFLVCGQIYFRVDEEPVFSPCT
jgi:hypothetical protein